MWRTNTYWFDVAVVMTFLMLGQLFLGRFSEYQPRSRRLLKSAVGVGLLIALAVWAGREWMYALLGVMLVAILVVHGWLLPKKESTDGPPSRENGTTRSWASTPPAVAQSIARVGSDRSG